MADSTDRGRTSVLTPRRVAGVLLLALFVVFVLQNRTDVTIQLLGLRVTGPVWAVLLVSFAVGGLVVRLLTARAAR